MSEESRKIYLAPAKIHFTKKLMEKEEGKTHHWGTLFFLFAMGQFM